MPITLHSLASRDLERSTRFYTEQLGLSVRRRSVRRRSAAATPAVFLAFGAEAERRDALLRLEQLPEASGKPYDAAGASCGYWKIGVTLGDLDLAHGRLRSRGVEVSDPVQFEDIGYLCHLRDPDGHIIELLQYDFEGDAARLADDGSPLGQPVTFAHVTLRCTDAEASVAFYRQRLGMRLISRQPVADFGFTLYFLADQDDPPPDPDLEAVGNRPWLWRRPYTVLELQCRPGVRIERGQHGPGGSTGWLGTAFQPMDRCVVAEGAVEAPDGAVWALAGGGERPEELCEIREIWETGGA